MKIIKYILIAAFCIPFVIKAQEKQLVKEVKGEAQVTWDQEKESKEAAKKRAFDLACLNALEKAFGTSIIQGNDSYSKNVNDGKEAKTQVVFNMIGNTQVKGDIVEVLKEEYEEYSDTKKIKKKKVNRNEIKCKVSVYAKELTEPKLDIEAFAMKTTDVAKVTLSFYEGENLYVYFKSPVSGYVTIFIDDSKDVQRILPYQSMDKNFEGGVPVEADKVYVFFSKKSEHQYFKDIVPDELELSSYSQKDLNNIFVVFTKTPQNKPYLKDKVGNLQNEDANKGYTLPKGLSQKDFLKWRVENQQLRADIQVISAIISIEKK